MNYLILWLILFLFKFLISTYLLSRQYHKLTSNRDEVPKNFTQHFSLEGHQQSIDYALVKIKFGFIQKIFSSLITLSLVLSPILGFVIKTAEHWTNSLIFQTIIVFFLIESVVSLLSLPFSYYSQFVLEEKFGFNKMTPHLFIQDLLKGAVLSFIIGVPVLYVVTMVIVSFPQSWGIGAALFLVLFQFLLMWLYPTLIAPFFNKFTPLEKNELREKIEKLFARSNRPAKDIYVMDASKRSGHGNAYFTGIGKAKRIVFFDTLLQTLTVDETLGVLAHELGHLVHKHIIKMLGITVVMTFMSFILLQYVSQNQFFYEDFSLPIHPVSLLFLASWWAQVLGFFFTPFMSIWSRKNEYQADKFATKETGNSALKSALLKLYKDNKSPCVVDKWYATFYFSHPPLSERLDHLDSI